MSLKAHLLGRGVFPSRYAWFLEGRWRRLVLSPKRLERRLPLSGDSTVLEIGVGGGNYARPLSRRARRFLALDIQREMLQRLKRKSPVRHLLPVQGDATRLPFADGTIDLVIAVTVLGETPSPDATIAEAARVLRPGGVFSVSEHWPDPDFLRLDQVERWCRNNGLRLEERFGVRFNYTANFRALPLR